MALLLLLISSLAIGFVSILNKKLSRTGYPPSAYTFITLFVSTLISIPLLLYKFQVPDNIFIWLFAFFSASVYGLSNIFAYKAYKLEDASSVSLIHRFSMVVAAFGGILILGEKYSFWSYIGLFLIMLCSFIILYENKKIKFNEGITFAFIMATLSAIAGVMDKVILNYFSAYSYVFINNFFVVLPHLFRKKSVYDAGVIFKNQWKLIIPISMLMTGSWVIFLIVLQSYEVSKVIPIYKSLSLFVPVILGIFLLNEKSRLSQKIIGMVFGIIGIILLSFN